MIVPVKTTFKGDRQKGEALVGWGNRLMQILENQMSFQNLEQDCIERAPYPGAMVKCSKVFGLRTVEITVPGGAAAQTLPEQRKCICFPHLAFGIVKRVIPAEPDPGDYIENPLLYVADLEAYQEFLIDGVILYDVLVCKGRSYVLVENVYSSGWERYYEGQFVMVSIGNKLESEEFMPLDCDRTCLMQEPRFPVLVIVPIHVTGKMKEWFRV